MIRDLDATLANLLTNQAPPGSELASSEITFDLPDSEWRQRLNDLTVNCYLYDVRENMDLRTTELIVQRSADGLRAARIRPPVRIDCAYAITAWSVANNDPVLEEHRVLSQVLRVLLIHKRIPQTDLVGSMVDQPVPYPIIVAAPDANRNMPEFWRALDQELKPSLNYVVTLGMWLEAVPNPMPRVVEEIVVGAANMDELP
jgi:hypothetical protein